MNVTAKLFKFHCVKCGNIWDAEADREWCMHCDRLADVYCRSCRMFVPVARFDFLSDMCTKHPITTENQELPSDDVLGVFVRALNGFNGPDQRRIANVGLYWIYTLLAKNTDYGGSAWEVPCLAPHIDVRDALFCRMSDKVKRIAALSSGADPKVNESLEDTVKDLGAYCLLWLARPGVNDETTQ